MTLNIQKITQFYPQINKIWERQASPVVSSDQYLELIIPFIDPISKYGGGKWDEIVLVDFANLMAH